MPAHPSHLTARTRHPEAVTCWGDEIDQQEGRGVGHSRLSALERGRVDSGRQTGESDSLTSRLFRAFSVVCGANGSGRP